VFFAKWAFERGVTLYSTLPLKKKKKFRSGCQLPGADMQKPHAKMWVRKNKNRPVSGFFTKIANVQVMNFIPVKVSTLY
jgi:hypothetical protein